MYYLHINITDRQIFPKTGGHYSGIDYRYAPAVKVEIPNARRVSRDIA